MLKNIVRLSTFLLLAAIAFAVKGKSSPRSSISEPIFGVNFDPTKIHYATISDQIRGICPNLNGDYWIFAHAKRDRADYYIVLGIEPNQDGDSFGTALEIKGSSCREQESKWLLSGHVPPHGYGTTQQLIVFPGEHAASICNRGALGDCYYQLRSKEEE